MHASVIDGKSDTLLDFNLLTYKDVDLLAKYMSAQGKIFPRRITKLSAKQQKIVTKLIKTARIAALLPFLCNSRRFKR